MSDPTIIAAAIVTVLAALTGAAVTIINAAAAARDRKDSRYDRESTKATIEATSTKADTIIEKAVEIHTLANSNLAKVTAALEVANEKIVGLQKLITSMIEAKIIADHVADKAAAKIGNSGDNV